MKHIILLLLLIVIISAAADAEIYTWTDEQGTTTYTDNPARIPSRYSGRTQVGEKIVIRSPKAQKEIKKHGKQWSQAVIPGNRTKSVAAANAHNKAVSLETQAEIKGHLGGDQQDPAPPSMKQPKPEPLGDQPTATSPGMKQPKALPLDKQPKETPAGMKQPTPAPLGDQPKPTPIGMEQPDTKR